MNSITTGLYMTLSAYLAEVTGESKYKDAAILSANWIVAHRYDHTNNIVTDSIDAAGCSKSAASWTFTYNSGKFIEGLSVLAAVTGDPQWTAL